MSELLETRDGKIVTLTLNRPESLNAFSISMMRGLIDTIERLGSDLKSVRLSCAARDGPSASAAM